MIFIRSLVQNWWVKEVAGILFKLHPIILLTFHQLNAGEAFLTLVISYLLNALFTSAKMVHSFGYNFVHVQLPKLPTLFQKIGSGIGNLVGLLIILFIHLFLYLIFFGLLFDAIQRPLYPHSIFDGEDGHVLIRTLIINGIWFLGIEIASFIQYARVYTTERNSLLAAIFWGVDFNISNKWRNIRIGWLMLFFLFFILMCTGFAFTVAIGSFFVFDLGYLVFQRMELRTISKHQPPSDPAL